MKSILLLTLITFSIFAQLNKKLLENKKLNYITMDKMYLELKTPINAQDKKVFCDIVNNNIDHINNIYTQDTKLVIHLRENEYFDYAKHLEENAATDLLSYYSYRNLCKEVTINFADLKQSFERNIINLNFLKMYHQQFMASIE